MRPPERAAFCLFARRVYFEIHFIKNGRRAHSKMSDIHSVMCSKLNCVYFSSLPLAASRGSAMFPCELRKFDAEYAEASRWSSVFARFDRMNLFRISLFGQMLPRKIWQKSCSLRWDTIPNWLAPCWRAGCAPGPRAFVETTTMRTKVYSVWNGKNRSWGDYFPFSCRRGVGVAFSNSYETIAHTVWNSLTSCFRVSRLASWGYTTHSFVRN